ncbi:MAG TPA: MerR family transcriptional regulator [Gaiellaceae bacterium]|nr:MerR family transcriptional regulator [Gaiellaceae bacterium]
MSNELLAIGDVARVSGKAPSAIRYYESIGLIAEPVRVSGRRRYPAEVVRALAVIDTAQRAGLALDDIRLLLRASADDANAVEQLREVAERRLPVLRAAIARAEVVREWLEQAADCCCPTLETCPLFEQPSQLPERRFSLG